MRSQRRSKFHCVKKLPRVSSGGTGEPVSISAGAGVVGSTPGVGGGGGARAQATPACTPRCHTHEDQLGYDNAPEDSSTRAVVETSDEDAPIHRTDQAENDERRHLDENKNSIRCQQAIEG